VHKANAVGGYIVSRPSAHFMLKPKNYFFLARSL